MVVVVVSEPIKFLVVEEVVLGTEGSVDHLRR
jgi:hypothetical protein